MKLHYTEYGSGDTTLVFLHYFGGAASTWHEVIDLLKNDFHCIAIDLLGFGKSPAQNTIISVDDSTDAVINLISALSLQNYILIGHSMGGKIALNTAAKQPEGLRSLILIAPSPPTPEPMTSKERSEMNAAFGDEEAIEKMIRNVIGHPLREAVFKREVNNNLLASEVGWHSWPQAGSKEDITKKMEAIHVPLSVLCGSMDKKFTKRFLQQEFEKYFSTFTLVEIPEAGHLLPVEKPEAVAEEIRKASAG